jgi:hypothetical protein
MQLPFEIKAKVGRNGMTLAEFDSEASAETWIAQRRLWGRVELIVKEDGKWVKR